MYQQRYVEIYTNKGMLRYIAVCVPILSLFIYAIPIITLLQQNNMLRPQWQTIHRIVAWAVTQTHCSYSKVMMARVAQDHHHISQPVCFILSPSTGLHNFMLDSNK